MKIKLSRSQWELLGIKSGWMKKAIIPDDGMADGGTPYTNEEMDLMQRQEKQANEIKRIKEEAEKVFDEFASNLLSKEGLELRLKELIGKMYIAKMTQPNPNVE